MKDVSNENQLSDYLEILRRRKSQIFAVAVVVLIVSLALAFGLTPIYRSTATIVIEQQEIPEKLVRGTVTGYVNQRLQIISQRVLTDENLLDIVKRMDLYAKLRKKEPIAAVLAKLREDISWEPVNANVTDPLSGQSTRATINFDLSFEHEDPQIAQSVANELVTLFLHENRYIREKKAEETTAFIESEVNKLGKEVTDLESRMATYKEENVGQLPELMDLNMRLMERTENEYEESQRQISAIEERKTYLEAQLSQLEPNIGISPIARLRQLKTDYLSASSRYAPNHPDVVNLKREIEALEADIGQVDDFRTIADRILKVREALIKAREQYSSNHPDVVRLGRELKSLEEQYGHIESKPGLMVTDKPDNPAYVNIKSQLEAEDIKLKALHEKSVRLKKKMDTYEQRLVDTPRVEQKGLLLKRDYDNALKKYYEMKQKLMEARLASQMERMQKGERFTLLVPPKLPRKPERPNRPAILLIGGVLSIFGGVGFASLAEFMDPTIRSAKGIIEIAGAPPLATIPYFHGAAGQRNQAGVRNRFLSMIVAVFMVSVIALSYLATDHILPI